MLGLGRGLVGVSEVSADGDGDSVLSSRSKRARLWLVCRVPFLFHWPSLLP